MLTGTTLLEFSTIEFGNQNTANTTLVIKLDLFYSKKLPYQTQHIQTNDIPILIFQRQNLTQ